MNRDLKNILHEIYQEDLQWQVRNQAEAEQSRKDGDMVNYFDLAFHQRLPDTCWALEHWEESRRWYRHNAQILTERRKWQTAHTGPDYPQDELSDWEATTLVKAGLLESAKLAIERAVRYWQSQPDSRLILTKLGLHAAQIGITKYKQQALSVIQIRKEFTGNSSKEAGLIRENLHYELAQYALLLQQWDEYAKYLDELEKAVMLIERQKLQVYQSPEQEALMAGANGLIALNNLRVSREERDAIRSKAKSAFEDAMLQFYKMDGQIDWNIYFMRLNTCMVDDFFAGRLPDPNPFAHT